jgi:hypothetical protein
MSVTHYLHFELLLSRSALSSRSYRARLLRSPAGEAQERLRLPPEPAFQPLLDALYGSRSGRGADRIYVSALDQIRAPERLEAAGQLGRILFRFLFHGQLEKRLEKSLEIAKREGAGLALRLQFAAAPELASLPWEYLFDPKARLFLLQSAAVHIERIQGRDPGRSHVSGATLRVLAIAANPGGGLDAPTELAALAALAKSSAAGIELRVLNRTTYEQLCDALQSEHFDVLHFIGHGRFDTNRGGGWLTFEDDSGGAVSIPANTLASDLQKHPRVRLVVLNSCEGGQDDPSSLFPGVAQALIQHGVESVVAMQAPVSDDFAKRFCSGFYEGLAASRSLEEAMARGRKALADHGLDWAVPCLLTCKGAIAPKPWPCLRVTLLWAIAFAALAILEVVPASCRTLAISHPANHSEVTQTETITGSSCRLPNGQDTWIIVYSPEDKLYYPHEFKADLEADGHWVSRGTIIGGQQDDGKTFDLIAALADEPGGRRLAAGSSGLPALPDGVRIYQRIEVTRRKRNPKQEESMLTRRSAALAAVLVAGPLLSTTPPLGAEEKCLKEAWASFKANDFEATIKAADECIDNFSKAADRLEASLQRDGVPPYPPGAPRSEKDKNQIFKQGILNDVAAAYFVKGKAAESLSKQRRKSASEKAALKKMATEAYKATCRYKHALVWDPGSSSPTDGSSQGWFWSPCEAASDRLPLQ